MTDQGRWTPVFPCRGEFGSKHGCFSSLLEEAPMHQSCHAPVPCMHPNQVIRELSLLPGRVRCKGRRPSIRQFQLPAPAGTPDFLTMARPHSPIQTASAGRSSRFSRLGARPFQRQPSRFHNGLHCHNRSGHVMIFVLPPRPRRLGSFPSFPTVESDVRRVLLFPRFREQSACCRARTREEEEKNQVAGRLWRSS